MPDLDRAILLPPAGGGSGELGGEFGIAGEEGQALAETPVRILDGREVAVQVFGAGLPNHLKIEKGGGWAVMKNGYPMHLWIVEAKIRN